MTRKYHHLSPDGTNAFIAGWRWTSWLPFGIYRKSRHTPVSWPVYDSALLLADDVIARIHEQGGGRDCGVPGCMVSHSDIIARPASR